MINLIGLGRKKQLRASRRNSIWLRYGFIIVSVIIAINIILIGTLYMTYLDQQGVEKEISYNKERQNKEESEKILKDAKEYKENISAAKVLLDANISYSDMISTISNSIPTSCKIKELSVDTKTYKNSQQKMNFYCDRALGPDGKPTKSDYEITNSLLTNLEKSLVFNSIYIEKTSVDKEVPDELEIDTSLKTQDPAVKIPKAIPANCVLRTIHTLGQIKDQETTGRAVKEGSLHMEKYLMLTCRNRYVVKEGDENGNAERRATSRLDLNNTVTKQIENSCYFERPHRQDSTFTEYENGYYIANYTYTFSDITFKKSLVTKNGVTKCLQV